MAIGVRILSDDLSGQTANVTYLPDTGGTIDLGSQIFPFNYISDYYYGEYNCYVPLYGYTYSITVPGPTPTPTVTSTPTQTPTVTSTPTNTNTPNSSPSPTPTNTTTNTPTLTPTPSTTFGLTPTTTSSNTPTPTNTPSVTPTSGTFLASLQSCSNPSGPIVGQMVLPNSYQSYTTGPFSTWYSYTVIDTLGNCYNVAGIGGSHPSFTWSGIDTSMWINNFGLTQYTGCTQCITTPTPTNTSTTTPTQTPSAT